MKTLITQLIISTQALFAITSVAPVEIGDDVGLHTKVEVSLETKRGNTDKDNYKASLRVTYDSNASYAMWAEVSGEYGQTSTVEDTNKLYSHVRYIHKITEEVVRAEVFAQLQKDEYKLIQERAVTGAGARFRIFDLFGKGKGYAGIGGLFERIDYIQNTYANPSEENIRLNSYLAYSIDFGEKSSFSYTFYYQPLYNDINDYVGTHDAELKLPIHKNLYLKVALAYNADSKPPLGVKGYDFTQETALMLKF